MNLKRILLSLALLFAPALGSAQTALPNLTYNASLNATCSTPNAFCTGSVFTSSPTLVQTGQTGTALDVPSNNYAMATVTVAGTYAGATINFDFSDPSGGTSYFQVICARTDANILEASEVLPSNSTRSWQCPVFATYRFRVRVSAIGSGSLNTWITVSQTSVDPSPTEVNVPVNIPGSTDPCQNESVLKSSVPVNVSSATTTQLVALSAGKTIYVCGGVIASVGGTSTLEYGTGASCGTGTTALTGAFPAGSNILLGSNLSLVSTASANALCILSGASTTATAGFITYVQQ